MQFNHPQQLKYQPYFYPTKVQSNRKTISQSVDQKGQKKISRSRILTQTDNSLEEKPNRNLSLFQAPQDQLPKILNKSTYKSRDKPKLILPNNMNLGYFVSKIHVKTEASQDSTTPKFKFGIKKKIEQTPKAFQTADDIQENERVSNEKKSKTINNYFKQKSFQIESFADLSEPGAFMKKWDLSEEEWEKFGNRFPQNYVRKKLLGRGGFSLIWLGVHRGSGKSFAIKQLPKNNKHLTYLKEIAFCNHFFEKGGRVKVQFQVHAGSQNLVKMLDYIYDVHDTWIFFDVCGISLGTQLYDFIQERLDDARYFRLKQQALTKLFRQRPYALYCILEKIVQTLDLLQLNDLVHSDIKSENILIHFDPDLDLPPEHWDVKLIDFGSSFRFSEVFDKFSMATPEYMCPELLNFILKENKMTYNSFLLKYIKDSYTHPWVIDMWGLGCVLLEILSGLPLWMSLDTIVDTPQGHKKIDRGLFAVKGRHFDKIILKQIKITANLQEVLQNQNYSGIQIQPVMLKLLKSMLQVDPNQRLPPKEVLQIIREAKKESQ